MRLQGLVELSTISHGSTTYDSRTAYAVSPGLPVRLHLVIGTYEGCFDIDKQGQVGEPFITC